MEFVYFAKVFEMVLFPLGPLLWILWCELFSHLRRGLRHRAQMLHHREARRSLFLHSLNNIGGHSPATIALQP